MIFLPSLGKMGKNYRVTEDAHLRRCSHCCCLNPELYLGHMRDYLEVRNGGKQGHKGLQVSCYMNVRHGPHFDE